MPIIIPPEEIPDIVRQVRTYVNLKRQIDDLSKQQSIIKKELSDLVDEVGEADDKGHLWLTLPQEVDGYVSLKRERRVSQRLDDDEAECILKIKGLYDKCYEMLPVLNQDAVMSALYEGLLTETEVDLMFPKSIVWAFVPSKG